MTIDELRDAHLKRPFKPFTLELADGQRIPVPHPEFMTSAPKSRTIAVFTPRGTHKIIDLLMVVAIDFQNRQAGRRNGRDRA
jgi:hypothetical protein